MEPNFVKVFEQLFFYFMVLYMPIIIWDCRQNTTVFGLKSQYVIILICPLNSLRAPEVGSLFLIFFVELIA